MIWTDAVARLRTRYGLRGQRIGEAANAEVAGVAMTLKQRH